MKFGIKSTQLLKRSFKEKEMTKYINKDLKT